MRTTPAPIEFAMPAPKRPIALPRHLGCLVKMLFGFALLLLMGYFALIALNPKAREWATKGAKDGSGGPTPFNTVNQVLAIPAQAIGKTKDVVAAGDARVGVLDGVIAEEEGKKKKTGAAAAHVVTDPFAPASAAAGPGVSPARAAAAASVGETGPAEQGVSRSALLAMHEKMGALPDPSDPAASRPDPVAPPPPPDPPAPAEVKLAGGIIIASASPADGPVVRSSFFFWIVKQNITGVFQSPPHRLMLNGQLVYEGDVINRALGITFDHLDPAKKVIVFRDNTGALVTRSY